ncbi:hypothetical protein A4R43_01330 [Amycolatopsis albispora]|uniref:PBS lyase n=1 Tax=Amycolatopsis albispora TaxID=1804986 RepID=A0A344KZV4_9PSEU|nr:hypothetical protein A4R43_01330 [Amycolatopsis albispora]
MSDLIEHLEYWRTGEDGGESLRDEAIAALKARGPKVVPVLVKRLEGLLGTPPGHRHELKGGLVEALHRLGDRRAGPVLTASLADDACAWGAALALKDIHHQGAVPALLDALARAVPNGSMVGDYLDTLRSYQVSPAKVENRFHAEVSPQGRANLMEVLAGLAADGAVDASTFARAAGDPTREVRWAVADGLLASWRGPDPDAEEALLLLALDEEESVSWRAVRALEKIRNGPDTGDGILPHYLLTPSIYASAIRQAATRQESERAPALVAGLERVARTQPVATQGIREVITRVPEPPVVELYVALELLPPLKARLTRDDPMGLLRPLHTLSSHADAGVARRAKAALRSGNLLFSQMVREDGALAEEATGIFEAVAGANDRARFERYAESRPQPPRPKRRLLFWRR